MTKKKSETQNLVKSIHDSLKQRGASSRDEISVMKCMLNDSKYVVDVYSSNSGEVEKYCPYDDVRSTYKNVLKSAGMTADEAQQVADNYVCTNADAKTYINIGKDFIHTYLGTGRKLPLGGREQSNVSLIGKTKPERPNIHVSKVGINEDGSDKFEMVEDGVIPEYKTVKVISPVPSWLKKDKA